MDRNGCIAVFCIFIFISTNCHASSSYHWRKLIDSEHNNASTTSEVSPTRIPVNETKTNPINTEKPQPDKETESQMGNQTNSSVTLPIDPKGSSKHENDTKIVGAPSPPADAKNANTVPIGNEKANETTPNSGGHIDSCEGSMVSCMDRKMVACVHTSNDSGSKGLALVVKNEGETTLKVNVLVPNDLINDLPAFEVPKHETKRVDISSIMGKSTELIVNSGMGKCVLPLVKPASVQSVIHQLSFYSKQVTPIYAVYASFIVALLLGGTWACCRFSKRNQQDGIAYQELEMGLPESSSAVNVYQELEMGLPESSSAVNVDDEEEEEGWDDNWDDDWDEDSTVKSPSGNQVRSVSSDGLVSRSPKKDGWENDWND